MGVLTIILSLFAWQDTLNAQTVEREEISAARGIISIDENDRAIGVINMDGGNESTPFMDSLANAQKGSLRAQLYVADLYKNKYDESHISSDLSSSIKWYTKAAENGGDIAMYELGNIYGNKNNRKLYDPAKSFEYYMRGDKAGNGECAFGLASIYMQDDGLYEKNIPYAAFFLEKYIDSIEKRFEDSADNVIETFIIWPDEYRMACKTLGEWYLEGTGVEKNPLKGKLLISKSAEDNFKSAGWWNRQYEKSVKDNDTVSEDDLKYWIGHWYTNDPNVPDMGFQMELRKDGTMTLYKVVEQIVPLIGKVKISVGETGTYKVGLPIIEFSLDKSTITCTMLEYKGHRVNLNDESGIEDLLIKKLANRISEMFQETDKDVFEDFNDLTIIISPSLANPDDVRKFTLSFCDREKDECTDIVFVKGIGWY